MKKFSVLGGFVLLASLLVACGGDPTATSLPATTLAATAATSKVSLGDDLVQTANVANQSGNFNTPLDSTPDLDGTNIYFTASSPKGPGVFKVAAAGGAATEVVTGAPFVAPRGIAISPDGKQIYIADPKASAAGGKIGQIFVLPIGGGSPTPLAGSAGTAPQNLDIVSQAGQMVIYFSGKEPTGEQAALFKLPAAGAEAPEVVVKGAPLVEPDGVAVTRSGVIYLSDRTAAGGELGKIFKVSGSSVTPIVEKIKTGSPAGIALTKDDAILLISALQMDKPSDQVFLVNLSTLETGSVTKVVSANRSAGGLHIIPSRDKNLFSWADLTAGSSGSVYRIGTR